MINHRYFMTACLILAGVGFFFGKVWPFGVICVLLALLIYFKSSDAPDAPTPPAKGKRGSRSKGGKKSS